MFYVLLYDITLRLKNKIKKTNCDRSRNQKRATHKNT